MHRGRYKTFDVDEGYIENVNTGENCGKHIDLYCYTADENNIYYETPHIDYPENYVHVLDSGEKISVAEYMYQRGEFNIPYVIISDHTKITSIERFHIDPCNRFYSFRITPDIAAFLLQIGLDNFKVSEVFYNYDLLKLDVTPEALSGNEFIFFIDSEIKEVREYLNLFRLEILKESVNKKTKLLNNIGFTLPLENSIYNISTTLPDRCCLDLTINGSVNNLRNAAIGKEISLSKDSLNIIKDNILKNDLNLTKYSCALLSYYEKLFKRDSKLEDIQKADQSCPLIYGFTNQYIRDYISRLAEDCNEVL